MTDLDNPDSCFDCLNNVAEVDADCDPRVADYNDGDPRNQEDVDGDGLPERAEINGSADPLVAKARFGIGLVPVADAESDRLSDETNGARGTDPYPAGTDGDGMIDLRDSAPLELRAC